MSENKRHRVKFYSREDMAGGYQLNKAEDLLISFNADSDFDLIDLLEFYNIKLYFDNNIFLTSWNESQIETYKGSVELAYHKLKEKNP